MNEIHPELVRLLIQQMGTGYIRALETFPPVWKEVLEGSTDSVRMSASRRFVSQSIDGFYRVDLDDDSCQSESRCGSIV